MQLFQQDIIHFSQLENKLFDEQKVQNQIHLPGVTHFAYTLECILYLLSPYFFITAPWLAC